MAKKSNPFDIGAIRYEVDVHEITDALHRMDQLPNYVIQEIAGTVEEQLRSDLIQVFLEATDRQSEDSFPTEFEEHLLSVVSDAKFDVIATGGHFEISFDFNQLGDSKDLKRAFHQGARLKDGSRLDGPYEDQELANEDAGERHLIWEAIRLGKMSVPNPKGAGQVKITSDPNAWETTKRKYIEIWGNKAPQWLYLQFGQDKWEPKIRSYPIIERFSQRMIEDATRLFQDAVTQELERAQNEGTVLTQHGVRLARDTGELGPSGKPRRPGQFYPRR